MIGGETIVRLRTTPGGVDAYGDPAGGAEDRLDIAGCAVAPRDSAELTDRGRAGVIVGLTVYAPASADVTAADRFEVRGVVYEVDGEPGLWRSPFSGHDHGLQIALRRVEG